MRLSAGNCSILKISVAARNSGLIILDNPSLALKNSVCLEYCGLRTLAMVSHLENCFAIRQESRLTSSEVLTAINISALSTPASFSSSRLVPFPSTVITSSSSDILSSDFLELSITDTLCPSLTRVLASSPPTLPQPTITAFINKSSHLSWDKAHCPLMMSTKQSLLFHHLC